MISASRVSGEAFTMRAEIVVINASNLMNSTSLGVVESGRVQSMQASPGISPSIVP